MMLNDSQQKDGTLKLFFLNFFKEYNLRNTAASFEKEAFDMNPQSDLQIKANKTFLFEWWNIFFYLYSEQFNKMFAQKNKGAFRPELLNKLSLDLLFKQSNSNHLMNDFNNESQVMQQNSNFNNFGSFSAGGNNNGDAGFNQYYSNPNPPNQQKMFSNSASIALGNEQQHQQHQLQMQQHYMENRIILSQSNQNKKMEKNDKAFQLFSTSNVPKAIPVQNNSNTILNKKRKRLVKNNKLVFLRSHSAALNQKPVEGIEVVNEVEEGKDCTENEVIEEKDVSFKEQFSYQKKPRGSKYRGVSRNGNQWQVLIMVNKKKRYVGSYSNEEEAAKAYDVVALQNHGAKAKTNFDYLEDDVKKILSSPPLLKLNV